MDDSDLFQPGFAPQAVLQPKGQLYAETASRLAWGKVVARHPEDGTMDVALSQGSTLTHVPVAGPWLSTATGEVYQPYHDLTAPLPTPQGVWDIPIASGKTDLWVLVGFAQSNGQMHTPNAPIILGFLPTADSQMVFQTPGIAVWRHESGVYHVTLPSVGQHDEIHWPDGSYLVVGSDTAPTNMTAENAAWNPPTTATPLTWTMSLRGSLAFQTANWVSVQAFGATGDGTTDDAAAINAALATGKTVWIPYTPNGYAIGAALLPGSNQTIICDGFFVPLAAATLWHFSGCLNTRVLGTLRVEDAAGITTSAAPVFLFDAECRFLHLDAIVTNNVYDAIDLVDINESQFMVIHCDETRGTGITIDNGPAGTAVCNVHDNAFNTVFVAGVYNPPMYTSHYGILFNSGNNGTIGGNKWGLVTCLANGESGIEVRNTGMAEQWWDTVIADSNGNNGVRFYANTRRFFFGNLWCASNNQNGLYLTGSNATTGAIQNIQISNLFLRDNPRGLWCDGWVQNLEIGQLIVADSGTVGVLVTNYTTNLHIGSFRGYGQPSGLDISDGGDATSTEVYLGQFDAEDGYTLNTLALHGLHIGRMPRAGWTVTTPALPAATGSGDSVINTNPYLVRVWQAGGAGVHLVDASGTDQALVSDPSEISLDSGCALYFATTLPTAWQWFGSG